MSLALLLILIFISFQQFIHYLLSIYYTYIYIFILPYIIQQLYSKIHQPHFSTTIMLPPIKYKLHPKILQIQQQKRKRKQLLQQARQKQSHQLQQLKHDRQQYIQQNKQQIQNKQQAIYQTKLIKRNKIRQQDLTRAQRIANKKTQILMKLIPQRKQLIQNLRRQYIQTMQRQDIKRKQQLQKVIQQRLQIQSQKLRKTLNWSKQDKIKDNNIIDTNDGICVICLNQQAVIYMITCKHLVCCTSCQFMIRMNKKCPLCRANSKYENIKEINKKKPVSKGSNKGKIKEQR